MSGIDYIVKNSINKIKEEFPTYDSAERYLDALRYSVEFNTTASKVRSPGNIVKVCTLGTPQELNNFGICLSREQCLEFLRSCRVNNITSYLIKQYINRKKINKKILQNKKEPVKTYHEIFGREISLGNNGNLLVTYAELRCILNLANDGLGEVTDISTLDEKISEAFDL